MAKTLAALLLCVALFPYADAQQASWIDVPFVKQPAEGCGAASIAMVMQYWDNHDPHLSAVGGRQADSDVDRIQQELYSKPARGIYASDLQQYLMAHGFATYVVHGDIAL